MRETLPIHSHRYLLIVSNIQHLTSLFTHHSSLITFLLELFQKPHVVLKKQTNVIQLVHQR